MERVCASTETPVGLLPDDGVLHGLHAQREAGVGVVRAAGQRLERAVLRLLELLEPGDAHVVAHQQPDGAVHARHAGGQPALDAVCPAPSTLNELTVKCVGLALGGLAKNEAAFRHPQRERVERGMLRPERDDRGSRGRPAGRCGRRRGRDRCPARDCRRGLQPGWLVGGRRPAGGPRARRRWSPGPPASPRPARLRAHRSRPSGCRHGPGVGVRGSGDPPRALVPSHVEPSRRTMRPPRAPDPNVDHTGGPGAPGDGSSKSHSVSAHGVRRDTGRTRPALKTGAQASTRARHERTGRHGSPLPDRRSHRRPDRDPQGGAQLRRARDPAGRHRARARATSTPPRSSRGSRSWASSG